MQLWYPQALDAGDAETVTLEPGARNEGLDVTIGGVPASVSGTVTGVDDNKVDVNFEKSDPKRVMDSFLERA